ncbi:hypothetical protein IEO21_10274 [Rhodonia placenta]|uniref:Beta-mannosidase B n=1 Tax=Rhodonia placenta TaxID=104341 RepID=A0A8H7NSS7_9APHY|nr:hypothetical protein IEO21_10274 [Postia placenta]
METHTLILTDGWHWKERDPTVQSVLDEPQNGRLPWTIARSFPSEIHVELMQNGRIPDPFLGFNEHKREWLYFCKFPFSRGNAAHAELLLEGLDTVCDVYLNDTKVLTADNMFRSYSVRPSVVAIQLSDLRVENVLLLHFKSAELAAKELEKRYGRVRAGSANLGDPSRVYLRKAQYGWRYVQGPELMTCGPYRPISLITYTARLSDVHPRVSVSSGPALLPSLKLNLTIAGRVSAAQAAHVVLKDTDGGFVVREAHIPLSITEPRDGDVVEVTDIVSWDLDTVVELWWPVGYGKQKLYTLEVVLLGKNNIQLDQQSKRIGFRRIELIQEPLGEADQHGKGTTFLFEVNGVRMFMGGSNWIPAHNFLTQITPERYRAWLTLLRDGNQNMVRLWGGGVYEPDVFYDTCDELGILVWQDFQFACGVYPAHDEFVASVKAEAEDNVRRLRHHPAMALWCGNNEDYQQVLQWGGITNLPARLIYESVLPSVVAALTDPPLPYHRGSPYGGQDWDTADPTVGDIHQWDVWAGRERPWQEYGRMGGRFVSEFGIPSMPDIRTVDYWLAGNTKERWAQSKMMAQHNRAGNHERRFAILMNENFRLTSDLETHVYNTQLMQSEAVSLAYRMWRREWRGRGKEFTAGALVWQLNDCWPVTSWAIADFFLRAKPVYYSIARELAPVSVGIFRRVVKNRENDRPVQFYEFGAFRSVDATIEVWGTNRSLGPRNATLVLKCVDLLSDWTHEDVHQVVLLPNQSTELLSIPCPCPPPSQSSDAPSVTSSSSVVVAAQLIDPQLSADKVIARYADWPQPYRHVDVPNPGLRIKIDGELIAIDVEKPIKSLLFSTDDENGDKNVRWSDNALDVMPGDKQYIQAKGLGGKRVKIAYLGNERGYHL